MAFIKSLDNKKVFFGILVALNTKKPETKRKNQMNHGHAWR